MASINRGVHTKIKAINPKFCFASWKSFFETCRICSFGNISFFKKILIFVCAGSSLPHGLFSSSRKQGLLSSRSARASYCGGFSCWGARALGHAGFRSCGLRVLEHRFSTCGSQAWLLWGMWDLPEPKPMSPALAGGFFTTELSAKPRNISSSVKFSGNLEKFYSFFLISIHHWKKLQKVFPRQKECLLWS